MRAICDQVFGPPNGKNAVFKWMLAFVICLSTAAGTYPQISTSPVLSRRIDSSVSPLGNGRWSVSLSARDRWFDTGIFVERGATVKLSATGSAVWAPPGGRDMSGTVGPNGTRPPFESDRDRFPVPYAGCGALVMRIGSSTYLVGEKNSVKADESGTIRLMVNDDVLDDNRAASSSRSRFLKVRPATGPGRSSSHLSATATRRSTCSTSRQEGPKTGA